MDRLVPSRPVITVASRFAVIGVAVVALLPIHVAVAAPAPAAPISAGPAATSVVIVAVPGLRWTDLSPGRTPHLWAFAHTASRGLLAVKAAGPLATCGAAMTTLGAGNRATATPATERLCDSPEPGAPQLWPDLARANRHQRFGAQPGALGDALAVHGYGTRAEGGLGAWLAAAPRDGVLVTARPALTVVEDYGMYRVAPERRVAAARNVDERVASRLANDPANSLTLVVGAGDDARGRAGLRVAMAAGVGFAPGRLTSDSTGRTPYVELIDVAPTVLASLHVPRPSSMAGQPWRVATRNTSLAGDVRDFVDMSKHASMRAQLGGWFVRVLVCAGAAACMLAAAFLFFGVRRARWFVEASCYLVAALPASMYSLQVFSWWRWHIVTSALVTAAIDMTIGLAAFFTARRRPPWGGLAVVAVVTTVVLGLDMLTGTHLQLDGLLGDSTTIAGRFHGAGNTDFAIFATAALLTAGFVAAALRVRGRGLALAGALAIGVVALVLDGAPGLGDDLGGVLALAPALAVLTLLLLGVRVGARGWLAAAALGLVAGVALIGYDAVSGGGHIGRFAGQAGRSGARVTIDRKLAANLGSWHRSDYVAMVVFGVIAVAVAARGPLRRALGSMPPLAAGLAAVAVCAVLGGALNDSGAVVPGASAVVAVPLILAGCLRAQS